MAFEKADGSVRPIHVYRTIPRTDPKVVEGFRAVSSATVHEAYGKKGAFDPSLRPLDPGTRLCGPAVTVQCLSGDNLMIHKAVEVAAPGDILVVAVAGSGAYGYWGDLLTASAQARGLAGLVIDGCVRDRDEIAETGFPVFSAGLAIRGTSKQGLGLVNHPIACGGQLVWPGDLVLGDADGLVAVAREAAGEVLQRARDRESFEAGERAALAAGDELTLDRFGLREGLSALGMNER